MYKDEEYEYRTVCASRAPGMWIRMKWSPSDPAQFWSEQT